jgi:hypothetical protein
LIEAQIQQLKEVEQERVIEREQEAATEKLRFEEATKNA